MRACVRDGNWQLALALLNTMKKEQVQRTAFNYNVAMQVDGCPSPTAEDRELRAVALKACLARSLFAAGCGHAGWPAPHETRERLTCFSCAAACRHTST